MKVINLVENTEGNRDCLTEHGLSFYIETTKHKILLDTGASDLFLENAKALGVDLSQVDTVVLSHGHYDHGGGLSDFLKMNSTAKVYLQKTAFSEYYSIHEETRKEKYIGLNQELKNHEQIVAIEGNWKIDDELFLVSRIHDKQPTPKTNQRLKKCVDGVMVQDDFLHEQCLVIHQGDKNILFSGCAHHGILNIMETYRELFGSDPDVVISGFHLMRKHNYSREDVRMIIYTAKELIKYESQFYTCHCTGEKPYETMKKIMGYQLKYIHSGDRIVIGTEKKHKVAPWSKYVAGVAVLCMTISILVRNKK